MFKINIVLILIISLIYYIYIVGIGFLVSTLKIISNNKFEKEKNKDSRKSNIWDFLAIRWKIVGATISD